MNGRGRGPAQSGCPLTFGPCILRSPLPAEPFVTLREDQPSSGREGRARPTDFLWLLQKTTEPKILQNHTVYLCSCPEQRRANVNPASWAPLWLRQDVGHSACEEAPGPTVGPMGPVTRDWGLGVTSMARWNGLPAISSSPLSPGV